MPRKISRWLADGGPEAGKQSLVTRRDETLLFVRGMRPHPDDSIALLVERVGKGSREAARRHGKLTAREVEVLGWMAYGKSDDDIARVLERSVHTIGKHVGHILVKLGVENRAGAAVEFYRGTSGHAVGNLPVS